MSMSEHDRGGHRLTIRRGGQDYRGLWREAENAVYVTSPYGEASAPRGPQSPRDVAETLLGQMAFRWSAARTA